MLHLFVRTAGGEVHLPSPKSPGQRLLVVVKDKALIVTTKLFFWNRVSHLWYEYAILGVGSPLHLHGVAESKCRQKLNNFPLFVPFPWSLPPVPPENCLTSGTKILKDHLPARSEKEHLGESLRYRSSASLY